MPATGFSQIDPQLTSRLGQLAINWGVIENWLGHLLAALIGAEAGALSVVTQDMSAATIIQISKTTISIFETEHPEFSAIRELLDFADDIRGERNELVHGIWESTNCQPGTALVQNSNWKKSEIIRERLVTTTELDQLLIDCQTWLDSYVELGLKFNFPRTAGSTKSIFAES